MICSKGCTVSTRQSASTIMIMPFLQQRLSVLCSHKGQVSRYAGEAFVHQVYLSMMLLPLCIQFFGSFTLNCFMCSFPVHIFALILPFSSPLHPYHIIPSAYKVINTAVTSPTYQSSFKSVQSLITPLLIPVHSPQYYIVSAAFKGLAFMEIYLL